VDDGKELVNTIKRSLIVFKRRMSFQRLNVEKVQKGRPGKGGENEPTRENPVPTMN
jgi:hypothetical protein